MGLVFYLAVAWIVIISFFSLQNRLPSMVNIIIYLVIQIIHINFFSIITLEFKNFTYSPKPMGFITIIVYRDVVLPFLLLIFVNVLFSLKSVRTRTVITAIIFIISLTMEQLLSSLGYIHDRHWSIWYRTLFIGSMMILSILVTTILKKLSLKEKQIHGDQFN